MQQQAVWSTNLHNDDTKTDCFRYIVKQCSFYMENVGLIAKKVLCKPPWPILSKQFIRKKKKQKPSDCRTSEKITKIDVISLFQSPNLRQESFTVLSTQSIATSKPQISRQLLESLVTVTDPIMPLAQNYKDDVSLLESETALSKATMNNSNTEFATRQGTNTTVNYGNNLGRNGLSSNVSKASTSTNSNDMLADDDLPEVVSLKSTTISDNDMVNRVKN